ncbi:MAG: hypothetical protein WCO78_03040 [Candidatus Roizmanbacteria bacterium]
MSTTIRTTTYLPEALYTQLRLDAARQKKKLNTVIVEKLTQRQPAQRAAKKRISAVGMFNLGVKKEHTTRDDIYRDIYQ